jgi:hypothetical protein
LRQTACRVLPWRARWHGLTRNDRTEGSRAALAGIEPELLLWERRSIFHQQRQHKTVKESGSRLEFIQRGVLPLMS